MGFVESSCSRSECRRHATGLGIGCDIVIGRLAAEQQVAHASANQVGFVAALPQGADDRDGEVFEHGSRDGSSR